MPFDVIIRQFAELPYESVWQAMRDFTDQRTANTVDEFWLLQHPAVFTQGQAGKPEHLLNPGAIPVIQTDRGGQVTYHGPGQLIVYALCDLKRLGLNTRSLVSTLEKTVIDLLASYGIHAATKPNAPGVYVNDAKICSIGLRVRRGCSYHGIALNIAMDLNPFSLINPCGYKGMAVTQIQDLLKTPVFAEVQAKIIPYLLLTFGYTSPQIVA